MLNKFLKNIKQELWSGPINKFLKLSVASHQIMESCSPSWIWDIEIALQLVCQRKMHNKNATSDMSVYTTMFINTTNLTNFLPPEKPRVRNSRTRLEWRFRIFEKLIFAKFTIVTCDCGGAKEIGLEII